MCWSCDRDMNSTLANGFAGGRSISTSMHFAAARSLADASLSGGELAGEPTTTAMILIGEDSVPDDTSTTQTLTVGAPSTIGTLETIGDQDYYKIELVAGETYEIGMYAKYDGPNGVPLLDSFFEIRDAAGNLIETGDGDGETVHNSFFTGFDALVSFTAPETGVYYINARAYDDGVTGDDTGNYVGDYELFVREPAASGVPPEPPSDSLFPTTVDTAGNDLGTTATIAANGAPVISTIDAPRDQDFYRIEMQAGMIYRINQSAQIGGPSGIPVGDAYFEIYDAAGTLIATATAGGPMPSGLVTTTVNAQFDFAPTASGTYYINARYANYTNADGSMSGEGVGDYKLGVEAWKPYYSPDSPLYAIDWGTEVDGSLRNPDGQEGPRPTGNEPEYRAGGKNVIYYYFAKQGEVFISEDPANPGLENMVAAGFRDWEIKAYEMALDQYEKVADIVYVEVQKREEADFIFITYDGTPQVGVLGRMSPPDTQNEGQTEFNRNGPGWNEQSLKPGGFSFQTLMHELGHGHGMAHPHDNGGRSGVMRGVEPEGTAFDYTTGDFDLNQGVFTIMSYEDGWQTRPAAHGAPPTTSSYGWVGSLSPFDIAVIQDKYGVNEEWATGDDVYELKDVNSDGTFYSAIWDAAGTDAIVYSGARDATIDLRAATLEYETGGGGRVSYALGIHGGFTIANGVTIENARGGDGHDSLTGNEADNVLTGGNGNDSLTGNGGNDSLIGNGGADRMTGGAGNDIYSVSSSGDKVIEAAGGGVDTVRSAIDYRLGDTVENLVLTGTAVEGWGNKDANSLTGNAAANLLVGGAGNDRIAGDAGNDRIGGGTGKDVLDGGAGRDTFFFDASAGSANADTILAFSAPDDTLFLDRRVFTKLAAGALGPDAFRSGTAAADADDRIVYDQATGKIFYDKDGAGGAAGLLFATVDPGTALTHADFMIYG